MTIRTLWFDTETFSLVDIKNGTDNYSRAAEIMMMQYAYCDEPARVWDITDGSKMPADLARYLADETLTVTAHNAAFDSAVMETNGYHIDQKRWRCTMAQALAHGLPGALEKLGEIFKIDDDKAKLKDGKSLVRLFCCPRPKNMKLRRATKETHPTEWERFKEYGRVDVEAMREVAKAMPNWNYTGTELALWQLDQKINKRGVNIDMELVNGAIVTAERTKTLLAEEAQELTDYDEDEGTGLKATTQRDALLYLLSTQYNIVLTDLKGSTIERLLKTDHDMPQVVVELLENRIAASSTSVSKYKRFMQLTGPDGRLRNTLQFCGASRTGRWAGRGVQLQNLPRPVLKQKVIDSGIEAIKLDCADLIFDKPMELLSSAIRGCIVASPGKKLVVADLSNIEGRMLAWLAGEEWKLQAFADYDTCLGIDGEWYTGDQVRDAVLAGEPINLKLDKKGEPTRKGHDLYALSYAKAFRISPEEVMENKRTGDGSFRQIGKVMELALGYSGGAGAFVTFAIAYGINLNSMADTAAPNIPPRIWAEAERTYEWAKKTSRDFGMAPKTFMVCDSFKRLWREAHPEITAFWGELELAFRKAILSPGKTFTARKIKMIKSGAWLRAILPSGRSVCYPAPKISDEDKISYMGVNQFSRQWNRITTYSGKLAENFTQAASRDVIAARLPAIEKYAYSILTTVHDEDICEADDDDRYSSDELAALMSKNPDWATGLPLAAAGFSGYRYRKE